MMRKGAARGTGSGYRNLANYPRDPMVHRQSANGIKQPQGKPIVMMGIPTRLYDSTTGYPEPTPPPKSYPDRSQTLNGNLSGEALKETNEALERIKTDEGLKEQMAREHKSYKKNEREQFTKYLKKKYQARLDDDLQKVEAMKNAPDFSTPLTVTVEWTKSRMWGSNPRAFTNFGFESESVGGCGYDKLSTALAYALNSHLPLMKELVKRKESMMNTPEGKELMTKSESDFNRKILGYGSGYGIIPHFEGGVGVESHKSIIENVGLVYEHPVSTPNTDVFIIRKKGA
ncbi:hypothetical protein MUP79_06470 [Candidatus Bathyarchaeota archaeon]|nr:hypothetical protein [Candidatus Bathyarchaeota archaeon]